VLGRISGLVLRGCLDVHVTVWFQTRSHRGALCGLVAAALALHLAVALFTARTHRISSAVVPFAITPLQREEKYTPAFFILPSLLCLLGAFNCLMPFWICSACYCLHLLPFSSGALYLPGACAPGRCFNSPHHGSLGAVTVTRPHGRFLVPRRHGTLLCVVERRTVPDGYVLVCAYLAQATPQHQYLKPVAISELVAVNELQAGPGVCPWVLERGVTPAFSAHFCWFPAHGLQQHSMVAVLQTEAYSTNCPSVHLRDYYLLPVARSPLS